MRALLATPELCPQPAGLTGWPRPLIEAAIEALLAELDVRDGDPDMEPNGDIEYDIADMECADWMIARRMHHAAV